MRPGRQEANLGTEIVVAYDYNHRPADVDNHDPVDNHNHNHDTGDNVNDHQAGDYNHGPVDNDNDNDSRAVGNWSSAFGC